MAASRTVAFSTRPPLERGDVWRVVNLAVRGAFAIPRSLTFTSFEGQRPGVIFDMDDAATAEEWARYFGLPTAWTPRLDGSIWFAGEWYGWWITARYLPEQVAQLTLPHSAEAGNLHACCPPGCAGDDPYCVLA